MNSLTDRFSFSAELPVAGDYDVVVCGGGPAGCVAAIQSARAGAQTALIEKNGTLGGTTVVAAVDFPGLFHAWGKQVIAGIGWQVIEETVRRGGATLPDFSVEPKRHWQHQVRVNRFVYSTVLDEFCHTSGVAVRLHEMPAAVRVKDGAVYMVVTGKTGLSVLRARKVVDATGDANVVGMMGLPREKDTHLQPGSLIYRLSGYDPAKIDKQRLAEVYRAALAADEILPTDHSSGMPPLWGELRGGGGSSMHVTDIDGSTSLGRTTAEQRGRQALMRVYRLLRKVPGCENLRVDFAATECGVRETWRIAGEKFVDREAYTSGRVWPDAVCYSFYPIDVHRHDDNTIDTRPLNRGVVPTIPYGALVPKGSDHLLAAGRCISGDAEASSAYRVQASAMATGQAAGAAAAIAAKKSISVRAVELAELRAVLRANQAIVPGPSGER